MIEKYITQKCKVEEPILSWGKSRNQGIKNICFHFDPTSELKQLNSYLIFEHDFCPKTTLNFIKNLHVLDYKTMNIQHYLAILCVCYTIPQIWPLTI